MKIGFGKKRIFLYMVFGALIGLSAVAIHEFFEFLGFYFHYFYITTVVLIAASVLALLAFRENAIYKWGSRLDVARRRVNDLMITATAEKHWTPVLEDKFLPTCWQQLDCDYEECPAYGREHARCWLIAGTFCRGQVQGQFARKLKDCRLCQVYKDATDDPVKEITENFYAMNYLLSEREEELEKAYIGTRERSEKLAGLVSLSEAAISSFHLADLLQKLLEQAASFAGADMGFISLLDAAGENLVCRATYGLEPETATELTTVVGEGIIGQAFAGNYIAISEDVSTDSRVTRPAIKELGARTLISIPLHTHEQTLGMLTLVTLASHYYTEEEKNTLTVAADRIAAAVHTSRLAGELDRDRVQAELVTELTEDLDARRGVVSVYDSFVKLANRLIGFDRASLAIWHPQSNEFEIVAMDTSAPKTWLNKGIRLPKEALPFGRVLDERRYLLRDEIVGDEYPADKLLVEEGIRSEAIFPLISKGDALGTLNLASFKPGAFSGEDAMMLEPLTKQLGLVLDSARLLQEARSTSLVDSASGLYNHRYFYEAAVREVARSKRHNRPLSMMILDVDGFREFRKSHTVAETDDLVRQLAGSLKGAMREIDIIARYSSDEFAILLPDLGIEDGGEGDGNAVQLAGRIRETVGKTLTAGGGDAVAATIYMGLAEFPAHSDDANNLIERADWALREARERDEQIVVASRNRPAAT